MFSSQVNQVASNLSSVSLLSFDFSLWFLNFLNFRTSFKRPERSDSRVNILECFGFISIELNRGTFSELQWSERELRLLSTVFTGLIVLKTLVWNDSKVKSTVRTTISPIQSSYGRVSSAFGPNKAGLIAKQFNRPVACQTNRVCLHSTKKFLEFSWRSSLSEEMGK